MKLLPTLSGLREQLRYSEREGITNENGFHFHSSAPPRRLAAMIAIARFRTPLADSAAFHASLAQALKTFSERDGFLHGDFGQNLDEPELWSLVTHWSNVGSYRRALSSTAIKMEVVPLLAQAIDEPGAYSNDL